MPKRPRIALRLWDDGGRVGMDEFSKMTLALPLMTRIICDDDILFGRFGVVYLSLCV